MTNRPTKNKSKALSQRLDYLLHQPWPHIVFL